MRVKPNFLIIAPVKPPFTGNALPIKLIYDNFSLIANIKVVDLTKKGFKSGVDSFSRVLQILRIIFKVAVNSPGKDLIYLTVAESIGGNIRDLFFYMVTFHKRKKMFIHMLGGNSMNRILSNRRSLLFYLNRFFISRLGGVVVEGGFQKKFYMNVMPEHKIHIVPNFAQNFLFSSESEIESKFEGSGPVRLLFISNFIKGKGYEELLSAFLLLSPGHRDRFELHFAGSFDDREKENDFIGKIQKHKNVFYHGYVSGNAKSALFRSSHIFCLPTYYPFEGQPFVIVEAYAAGCAVVTTDHSGIGYIFRDIVNGIEVEKKSVKGLQRVLENIADKKYDIMNIARFNFRLAQAEYTEERYMKRIGEIFFYTGKQTMLA